MRHYGGQLYHGYSAHCKGVKLKLFGSGYDATEGLGVNQLAGGVALPKMSIKSRC